MTGPRRSARLAAKALAYRPVPKTPMVPPTTAETSAYAADVQRRLELVHLMPEIGPKRVGLIVNLLEGVMHSMDAGAARRVMAYHPTLRYTIQEACERILQGALQMDTGQPWLMPPLRAVHSGLMHFLGDIRRENCYRIPAYY